MPSMRKVETLTIPAEILKDIQKMSPLPRYTEEMFQVVDAAKKQKIPWKGIAKLMLKHYPNTGLVMDYNSLRVAYDRWREQ